MVGDIYCDGVSFGKFHEEGNGLVFWEQDYRFEKPVIKDLLWITTTNPWI